jgi:hypothetical protein
MATYDESIRSITLDADSSLGVYTGVPGLPGSASPNKGKQYCFVKVTGAHQCGLADGTANEVVVGVMQNKPQVTGAAATVAIRGVSLVEAGDTVTAGQAIKVETTTGNGVAASLPSDAALVVGVALGGAAAGQLVPVLLRLGA